MLRTLFKIEFLQLLRHPISIFWSFCFPTVLLVALSFLNTQNPEATNDELNILHFILPGIIGVSLVSVSLFSIGTTLVGFREQSILKKYGTTPLKKWEYLFAHVLGRVILILIQSIWLVGLGYFLVGISPFDNLFSIVFSLSLGILAFGGIGLIIGSISQKIESASAISNLVFFPMIFLSGAYFPIDGLSDILSIFVNIIPLYHFVEMFRAVYIENLSILNFPVEICVLLAWFIVSIFIAKSFFKWESEV